MSSRAFIFRFLSYALVVQQLLTPVCLAEPISPEEVNKRYSRLIEAERARTNQENLIERLASGAAALTIGLYGYYNDDRGELTKVVYSATQTAGVLLISNSILDANQPSLLLLTDRYLTKHADMDLNRFKLGLVLIEQRKAEAEYKRLAYTSLILASLYGYDGYRSTGSERGLQNVFYFLSFNFALIAGANFYRMATKTEPTTTDSNEESRLSLVVWPAPGLRYTF